MTLQLFSHCTFLNYLYKVYFLNIQIFCKSKFAGRIKFYSAEIIVFKNFYFCCAVYSSFNIKIAFAKCTHDIYKIVHVMINIRFTVLLRKGIRAAITYKFQFNLTRNLQFPRNSLIYFP